MFKTAVGGLETENFSGDPRKGSSVRGFIYFDEKSGVMIE